MELLGSKGEDAGYCACTCFCEHAFWWRWSWTICTGSDKESEGKGLWERQTAQTTTPHTLCHICNRLPFTSDDYGALVLSSLCPAAHQGPHQGNAPAKYRSPIRRPSSDKQDKQVQFLAGLIKDSTQTPWPISSGHKKIKHRWGHMEINKGAGQSIVPIRAQKRHGRTRFLNNSVLSLMPQLRPELQDAENKKSGRRYKKCAPVHYIK